MVGLIRLLRMVAILLTLWLFILGIYFLKKGALLFAPWLFEYLHLDHLMAAFGLGWLAADVILSASPISAASMAMMVNHGLTAMTTLTIMMGARIGACFVILLVGCYYWLRNRSKENLTVGLLAVISTVLTYLPTYLFAALFIKYQGLPHLDWTLSLAINKFLTLLFDPIINWFASSFAAWLMFPVGIVLVLFSLEFFELALPKPDLKPDTVVEVTTILERWRMFGLGIILVTLTLSMGMILSLMVPIFQRRYIYREDIIPIALGANLGNFIDLALIALLLGNSTPISLVALIFVCLFVVNMIILLTCYRAFERLCLYMMGYILAKNYRWLIFTLAMLVIPIGMIWI